VLDLMRLRLDDAIFTPCLSAAVSRLEEVRCGNRIDGGEPCRRGKRRPSPGHTGETTLLALVERLELRFKQLLADGHPALPLTFLPAIVADIVRTLVG